MSQGYHFQKYVRILVSLSTSILVVALWGCAPRATSVAGSSATQTVTVAPTASAVSSPIAATPTSNPSHGWDAVAVAVQSDPTAGLVYVANYSGHDGQRTLFTGFKLLKPTFDGISPDGQDLLYQESSSGHTMYSRAVTQMPNTSFFYELNDASAGNAIWLPDSRNVLVLSQHVGVMKVDTQTGQSQTLLTLPIPASGGASVEIGKLTFYRDNYLYFIGAEGVCEDALCRVSLNTAHPTAQKISFRTFGTSYWLSPDGTTVYFANKQGPGGEPGIYAVNSDGTNLYLLRSYSDGAPIGYAADNALMIMRFVDGKFQLVKIGATPLQDQVVLADAAPGATSLCPKSDDLQLQGICDDYVALAPYGHAIATQGRLADGTFQLWLSDLITGKQMRLQVQDGAPLTVPVQLLGWDQRPAP